MTLYKDKNYFSWSNAFSPESIKEINQFIEADVETAYVSHGHPDYKKISRIQNSLKLINSPIIIVFSNMDDGGIIIVHINKFPAPVDTRILKYIK